MDELLLQPVRKNIIQEILSPENKSRKEEHRKRFEIYRDRPYPFLIKKLEQEFNKDTVDEMRHITSINLLKRIIDEKASLYKTCPDRTFSSSTGAELSDNEKDQLNAIYHYGKFDVKLKKANKWAELHQQCAIQVLPKSGIIDLRVLAPHQYDVIPDSLDPEKAKAYIISLDDRSSLMGSAGVNGFELSDPPSGIGSVKNYSDGVNQAIADADDYKKKKMRFSWWTKDQNFITNGEGEYIDPATDQVILNPGAELIANPLGELPFIDVASDKDMEFFVRTGSSTTEFDLEFLTLLTDTFFIHKMQGYSQAIVYSEKIPANFKVGPNHILHIPQDPNKEVQPRFEWASPSSDLGASLNLIETFLRLYLSSQGIDPKTVSGTAETQRFSSGIERLLAMIEKFEASRDMLDLFSWVEEEVLKLAVKWSNLFQGVTIQNGSTFPLIPQLQMGVLPEDMTVSVKFKAPEIIQTKAEKEESVIKLTQEGYMSRRRGIMELYDIDEKQAEEMLKEIEQFSVMMSSGGNSDQQQNVNEQTQDGLLNGQGPQATA